LFFFSILVKIILQNLDLFWVFLLLSFIFFPFSIILLHLKSYWYISSKIGYYWLQSLFYLFIYSQYLYNIILPCILTRMDNWLAIFSICWFFLCNYIDHWLAFDNIHYLASLPPPPPPPFSLGCSTVGRLV